MKSEKYKPTPCQVNSPDMVASKYNTTTYSY